MTALGTQPAVFALGRAVAVFHPGGAYFGGIPGGIDGEEGLRADLTAQCNKIVGVYFMHVIAVCKGLRFIFHVALHGSAPVGMQEHILPAIFAGKVATRPAQQTHADFLELFHGVPAHGMEMIVRHHGNCADEQLCLLRVGNAYHACASSTPGVRIVSKRCHSSTSSCASSFARTG